MPDSELVRSAVAGDGRAFHALVGRHAPALFRSALTLSRNRADAEDLLQETLIAAHRGLRNFEGRSSVKTWLLRIMSRQGFKALHRTRHHRATASLDAMTSARPDHGGGSAVTGTAADAAVATARQASPMAAVDQRLDIMHILQRMSGPHREVLVLREIQQLSYDEIAEVLGVPRGTVESRISRARAEFRALFGSERG